MFLKIVKKELGKILKEKQFLKKKQFCKIKFLALVNNELEFNLKIIPDF